MRGGCVIGRTTAPCRSPHWEGDEGDGAELLLLAAEVAHAAVVPVGSPPLLEVPPGCAPRALSLTVSASLACSIGVFAGPGAVCGDYG